MISRSMKISEHFHSSEFKCEHCGKIYIDRNLVEKLEHIFDKLEASKCIISSGYRCREYDIQIGGFAGKHSEGLAADCVYYDKEGQIIPAGRVICTAYDLGELKGIANIDGAYVHLDNRSSGTYYGDETKGNNSCWTDPYAYFGIPRKNDKTTLELAYEVIAGVYGNGEDRKKALGSRYSEVQKRVNELLSTSNDNGLLKLVQNTILGKYGNGDQRKAMLGNRYQEVQQEVNKNVADGNWTIDKIHLYK